MDVDLKLLTDKVLAAVQLEGTARHVLFDVVVHAARFGFSKGFSPVQVEALCVALATTANDDAHLFTRSSSASFDAFERAMLLNSSERIPSSRGIFTPLQAATAVDFVLRVYYARFELYKHALSRVPHPAPLEQGAVCGVEEPRGMPPLSEALLIEVVEDNTRLGMVPSSMVEAAAAAAAAGGGGEGGAGGGAGAAR